MTLIATWNVNSLRARLPLVLDWLKQRNPDIVLFQETKVQDEQFPYEPLEEVGYNIACFGQKSYNGVAILSKYPIEDIRKNLSGNDEDTQARYIEGFSHGHRIASIYVPNGQHKTSEKFQYKLKFLNHLQTHLKDVLSYNESFILGGDFNIAPTDADVYDPIGWKDEVLCTPIERQAFRSMQFLGLTDGLRAHYPEHMKPGQDLYTWWDYRAGSWQNNKGLRIDHCLLSPQASDRLLEAGVDHEIRGLPKASDHAPVWCKLAD